MKTLISAAIAAAFAVPCLAMAAAAAPAPAYAAGACSLVPGSQSCVDATPCKTLSDGNKICLSGAALPAGALAVPQTCWKYSYEFACDAPAQANTCTPYETNPACAVTGSTCTGTKAENGTCTSWNYTYQCETKAAEKTTKMQCAGDIFDTSSMTAPANKNDNFAKAAVAMEIARQSQVYEQGDLKIFKGVHEECTKGYFGLRDCCTGTPGAQSNRGFMGQAAGQAAFSVAKYAGEKAIDTVSPYVFDAMYSSTYSAGLMQSVETASNVVLSAGSSTANLGQAIGTNFASQGFTLGAYGFTYGTGSFSAASALPGTIDMTSTFGLGPGSGFVSFNPYVFAAMLALKYIMSLTQCSQDEIMFQMHKGANLSVYVGEDCSKRILGACVKHTEKYCSFNSVLAKIINIQGKHQMNRDIKDCAGLSPEEVAGLDFTKIDMSEFTGQLLQEAQNNLPGNIKGNYSPAMQNMSKGTSQTAGAGLAYPPSTPTTPPATPAVTP
jgi:conjugal transfer mating pair stabilization protein TraN